MSHQYKVLLERVLNSGQDLPDRTGVGCRKIFGAGLEFDLISENFPLCTLKHTSFKTLAAELLWMLRGQTNNEELRKLNGNDRPTVWSEWARENGDLGPIYGKQWRRWTGFDGLYNDQISQLITNLKDRPFSRRHLVSAWNVDDLPDEYYSPQDNVGCHRMALAPCHFAFQMSVSKNRINDSLELSTMVFQRSCDLVLGANFNVAEYALLTHIIAKLVNMTPKRLIWVGGDVHIYHNAIDAAKEMITREPYSPPKLVIADRGQTKVEDFELSDFTIENYKYHPGIQIEVAV